MPLQIGARGAALCPPQRRRPLPPQIAEAEAQKGSSGSKAIRDAALQALLGLLAAVAGPAVAGAQAEDGGGAAAAAPLPTEAQQAADALAFFLPGVAVGLCKALLLAASSSGSSGRGGAPAGPAASSAAAVAALQALVTLLLACLGDAAVEPALHGGGGDEARSASRASAWQGAGAADAELAGAGDGAVLQQALEQLQALAQRAKGGAGSGAGAAAARASQDTATAKPAPPPPQDRMRVERSAEWVQDSAERLHQLLTTALPPLLSHQRAAVRRALVRGAKGWCSGGHCTPHPLVRTAPPPAAVALPARPRVTRSPRAPCPFPARAGCCQLLDGCSMALQPRTQEALLQLLLSGAQDEWREVADPARTWLGAHAAAATAAGQPGTSSAFAAASERLLLQLLEGLPAALRSGDLPGRRHAQQLTSAIQASPRGCCCEHWPGWLARLPRPRRPVPSKPGPRLPPCACRSARPRGLRPTWRSTRCACSSCWAHSWRPLPATPRALPCCCTPQRSPPALPPAMHRVAGLAAARARRQAAAAVAVRRVQGPCRHSSRGSKGGSWRQPAVAPWCCCPACRWAWRC